MTNRMKSLAVAIAIVTTTSTWLISQAAGSPVARTAKGGNTITATATIDATYDPNEPTTAIKGRIQATGHKFGPRHCLSEREVWAYWTGPSGKTFSIDADNPTDRKGRFTFTQIPVHYGTDPDFGAISSAGGTLTYTLSPSPEHAPKKRGDITSSFKCPPVSTTVEVQVPPAPQY